MVLKLWQYLLRKQLDDKHVDKKDFGRLRWGSSIHGKASEMLSEIE